ncbi:MAG: FAD-dependent oxidoreductase [Pseudomonadota bacterium]
MLTATIFLLVLGFISAIMLSIAAKVFYVYEDPKIEEVTDAMLGANCGGCGYAGCSAAAEAVVKGKAKVDICSAGGFEIAKQVAKAMGVEVEEKEPEISTPGCFYGYNEAELKFNYNGTMDCRAATLLYGGSKECQIGCLGLATCVRACPFNALSMGENNLPVVNKEKCVSCGICADVCPKDIITLTSSTTRLLSDQKYTDCTAPCQRHCPAEIDIPAYIRSISSKNYAEAIKIIKEKNPFPSVCGWICPAPCESECRRNLLDAPVSINHLKKFVATFEKDKNERIKPYLPEAKGKKVSIIGGGVEGLTSAYYLRRLGHKPTVYEASSKLGGILRYVITEERLPRDVINWDIQGILDLGVEAYTEKTIGKDYTLGSLIKEDSEFVLLTTGGWDSFQIINKNSARPQIIPNTYLMLDFLQCFIKGSKKDIGDHAVIVGGGNTASKAANICLNNGASKVTIVFPYSEKEAKFQNINLELPENTEILFSSKVTELSGDNNKLSEIQIMVDNELKTISLNTLIVGSGRYPEMLFEKFDDTKWKTVDIFKVLPQDKDLGIFTVNNIGRPSDYSGVVVSVGRGRKMAKALHLFSKGEEIKPEDAVILDEKLLQNIHSIDENKNLLSSKGKLDPMDNLNEGEAISEAERCLNCGLLCYKKSLNNDNLKCIRN